MKILIIEDETHIAMPVKKVLESRGYVVDFCEDGISGIKNAELNSYDCILLDLNLPGLDGISLADKLRQNQNDTPIIMLTARSQIYDKLGGFEVGADDYITKPFDMQELLARVQAVIRRHSLNKQVELALGTWKLIPDQNKAVNERNIEVLLSNKECEILHYLIANKGRAVSTEEILEHVWDSEVDTFTETVKTHMKTLRQKIDPEKELIQTIRGKGYIVE